MQKEYPAVTGLTWHRSQYYSFLIPDDWCRFRWTDEHQGVIYGPDSVDSLTVLAVDVKDFGIAITTANLPALAQGFFEDIELLPHVHIETREQIKMGALLGLEAKFTYREENAETRKRWVRVFYLGTHQIAFIAQGATPKKYDYWLPWFYKAMMTASIHDQKLKTTFEKR